MDTLVMESSGNEWRLMHAIVLNAIVLACMYRFVRRRSAGDMLAALPQVLLGWFLVQYASVMLPGLLGVLNRWTMSGVAMGMAGLMYWAGGNRDGDPPPTARTLDRHLLWACILFFAGYLGAIIWNQRLTPVVSDDALTYHLPVAVQWLQTGRLVLHDVWFFNPANTYSPLAGSAFAAWWIAPMGNDYLARFMQVPGLVLIFFAMLQLGRMLGAPLFLAAMLALTTVLSRPFISQAILAKDDLFLSGFFIMAVLATAWPFLKDRLGPWRLGVAVGLFLATKITALLALPLLILLIDAPLRAGWRWRQWGVLATVIAILAGPWFVRNWWLTGNPLFPVELAVAGHTILPGMFRAERSLELRTLGGVWRMVTGSYFSLPPMLFAVLGLGWLGGMIVAGRQVVNRPLVRVCLIGPVLGLVIFAWAAPFPEVRFLDPAFLLLFAAVAVAAGWAIHRPAALLLGAGGLVVLSVATGFIGEKALGFAAMAAVSAAPAPLLVYVEERWPTLRRRLVNWGGGLALVAVAMGAYVYQDSLVKEYAEATPIAWQMQYGPIAEAWEFVRSRVPAEKTVAYTNTYLVYPLLGFEGERRVVYAPVRAGIRHLHDLPRLDRAIPGEKLREVVTEAIHTNADRSVWMENLRALGVEYLVIGKTPGTGRLPEAGFVAEKPGEFERVFENEGAVIYRER